MALTEQFNPIISSLHFSAVIPEVGLEPATRLAQLILSKFAITTLYGNL